MISEGERGCSDRAREEERRIRQGENNKQDHIWREGHEQQRVWTITWKIWQVWGSL